MDRGVKIAIFVASIVSLALGLIWDQVLNQARNVAQERTIDADELGSELISAVVGPPEVPRVQPPEGFEARPPVESVPQGGASETAPAVEAGQQAAVAEWIEYILQPNDSPEKLARRRFADRGLHPDDITHANPGCKWQVGDKVRIPPAKGASQPSTLIPPAPTTPTESSTVGGPLDYVVQDGDSWWKIAYQRFKDRFKERGLDTDDLMAANPNIKTLRPGDKIKIP